MYVFYLNFLVYHWNLFFLKKLAISILVAKFACVHLAAKFPANSLLNSGVVIYLSWSWSVIFFSISIIFVLLSVFLTKLLTLGILFLATVKAVVLAKLVMLGILPLISFILTLKAAVVAKLVILVIIF